MKFFTKSLMGAGAAAAALVSTATPAEAQYRYRDRDHISAGEVIAGAVVLGGLAAILSAGSNSRYQDGYYRRGYDGYSYYNSNGSSRAAINQCVNQVENWASRYSRSDVTQIRSIERTRYGYRVQGNLVVQDGWRGNDRYDRGDRYDQGYRYDRGDRYHRDGYGNGYNRGYDRGRFTCYVERGRVVNIDYNGLDRWN